MKIRLSIFVFLMLLSGPALATEAGFRDWLKQVQVDAVAKGLAPSTVTTALGEVQFVPRAIELDRKQPEGTSTFAQYVSRVLPQSRVDRGRQYLIQYRELLADIEETYGVPAEVIVALWGMESSYGTNTGGFAVVDVLATLAYEGRRAEFFRGELLNALQILDEEHITLESMTGSWAGAMGQCQFMPSSFLRFAVDANGDGKRDIWSTRADVFASAANYLSQSGWKRGHTWGREVRVPKTVDATLVGLSVQKPLSEWAQLGVVRSNGQPLPTVDIAASLVMPDGLGGRAFLVYDNYRVIMKWNRSTYFATAVGLLSDRLRE